MEVLSYFDLRFDVDLPAFVAIFTAFVCVGFVMNYIGIVTRIARFTYWWQVLTCYGLYMTPCAILIRHKAASDQYLWGLLIIGVLEFLGYSFQTSQAYPHNILDRFFTPRNFSLAMTLFFAAFFPLANAVVNQFV